MHAGLELDHRGGEMCTMDERGRGWLSELVGGSLDSKEGVERTGQVTESSPVYRHAAGLMEVGPLFLFHRV